MLIEPTDKKAWSDFTVILQEKSTTTPFHLSLAVIQVCRRRIYTSPSHVITLLRLFWIIGAFKKCDRVFRTTRVHDWSRTGATPHARSAVIVAVIDADLSRSLKRREEHAVRQPLPVKLKPVNGTTDFKVW